MAFPTTQLTSNTAKKPLTIVFSGHGLWDPSKDGFTQLPGNCTCLYFTDNARTLSDRFGGELDIGNTGGTRPDQQVAPWGSGPDMRLLPPIGLTIMVPTAPNWHQISLPGDKVPANADGIQVTISTVKADGMKLSELRSLLDDAIKGASKVTLIWAACRELKMQASHRDIGLNTMQR